MYFIDEMQRVWRAYSRMSLCDNSDDPSFPCQVLNNESAEFPSYQLVRLSGDRRYGYIVDAPAFTDEPSLHNPATFLLFTLSSTPDGRVFNGRYRWIDVSLAPLTKDDHQFRSMPVAVGSTSFQDWDRSN